MKKLIQTKKPNPAARPCRIGFPQCVILFLLLLFLPLPLYANPWEGKIIEQIQFDQDSLFFEDQLYSYTDLLPGDHYQADKIRKAVKRLYETGKFKEIWAAVEPLGDDRLILRFHWVDILPLSKVRFSGNHAISDKAILKAMTLKKGDAFNDRAWQKALLNIASLYQKRGYFQIKTTSRLRQSPITGGGVEALIKIREGTRTRIRKLEFLGNKIFSNWSLFLKIYSKKGEIYKFERLSQDLLNLERFYASKGYIKAVIGPAIVKYNGGTNEVDIAISILPLNKVDILFKGELFYPKKRLMDLLLTTKERNDDPDVIEGSAREIERFYKNEGFPFAKVSFLIKQHPEEKRMEVHFTIASGARTAIKKIQFVGQTEFSTEQLQEQIQLKKKTFFTKSHYTKDNLEEDVDALIQFYNEEGFQKIKIEPNISFDSQKKNATILFQIKEGMRTRIREIKITGNKALTEDHLVKALGIHPQDPFTEGKIREGIRALRTAYAKEGYPYVVITPSHHFSENNARAVITYRIEEGKQVTVGKITLSGNRETRKNAIFREIALQTGDYYDPEKILESQRNLYRTGLFSLVHFDPVRSEEKPVIQDFHLKVAERPRIALEFGVGYADRERLRGFVELSHRNLWGTGRSLSGRAEGSNVEERYLLNFREPWFFDQTISARITAAYIKEEEVSFDLKTVSGTIGLDKDFSETLKGSLFYQFERKETSDVSQIAALTSKDIGFFTIATLNPSLTLDTRDDPFNPSSGSVHTILFRDAAKILGSEIQLVKLTMHSRWYHRLSKKSVLAFSARGGAAERFGETSIIPISERFFIGGRNTVRGYDEDKLGIENVTIENGLPKGGNAMLIFNEELRYSVLRAFGIVLFFDHGNVWKQYQDVSFSDIKSTVGIGFRYHTPIGPFRLDYGYKLNREAGESPGAVHFTLGHAF